METFRDPALAAPFLQAPVEDGLQGLVEAQEAATLEELLALMRPRLAAGTDEFFSRETCGPHVLTENKRSQAQGEDAAGEPPPALGAKADGGDPDEDSTKKKEVVKGKGKGKGTCRSETT